jgi:Bifunctional DNA primase/polymerase, N-terminal
MTDRSLYEIAQEFAKRGYSCTPVNVSLGEDGKKKLHYPAGWSGRDFTQPSDWEGWESIAINTGRSGLVVVDLDTGNGKDGTAALADAGINLPPTPLEVVTQSGGRHLYYRAGDTPVKTASDVLGLKGVDIRARLNGNAIAPGTQVMGREYKARGGTIPHVSKLPVFPEDFAKRLAESSAKPIEIVEDYTPAKVTPEQREWARAKIARKLQDIAGASDGERWEVSKVLLRIFGLAKTIGEDLEAVAAKALAAFQESGGDDEERFIESVTRSIRNAKPENPLAWLPQDRAERFWQSRTSLTHIYQAARHHRASPWGVLGAVCVQVLADVPADRRLVTGGGPDIVPNLYVALGSDSGGGKGLAASTARQLWRSSARTDMPSSGEALRTMFAARSSGEQQWREPRSVIVNAPEVTSLWAAAERSGSSLIGQLCNGFFGDSLSQSVVDPSKNVDIPDGSYRLGMITGVQYGNAGILLKDGAATTGLAQRLAWFPANVKREDQAKVRPAWPGRLPYSAEVGGRPEVECDPVVAGALDEIKIASSAGELDPLDGHRGLIQLKLAYALAILDGHHTSVRESDWDLAAVMMEISTETRKRALQVVDRRAKARAKAEGEHQAETEQATYESKLATVAGRVLDKLRSVPHCHISRGELNRSLTSYQRPMLDEAIARLQESGLVAVTGGPGKGQKVAIVAGAESL